MIKHILIYSYSDVPEQLTKLSLNSSILIYQSTAKSLQTCIYDLQGPLHLTKNCLSLFIPDLLSHYAFLFLFYHLLLSLQFRCSA